MKEVRLDLSAKENDNAEDPRFVRIITTSTVSWILGFGWMFYFGSLILNLVYYIIHPSAPRMFTWGAKDELVEWIPLEEKDKIIRSNSASASRKGLHANRKGLHASRKGLHTTRKVLHHETELLLSRPHNKNVNPTGGFKVPIQIEK